MKPTKVSTVKVTNKTWELGEDEIAALILKALGLEQTFAEVYLDGEDCTVTATVRSTQQEIL